MQNSTGGEPVDGGGVGVGVGERVAGGGVGERVAGGGVGGRRGVGVGVLFAFTVFGSPVFLNVTILPGSIMNFGLALLPWGKYASWYAL